MSRLISSVLLLFLMGYAHVFAQKKNAIEMEHHTISNIFGNEQITSIAVDNRGIVYFSVSDGVAEFDGNEWRLVKLPVKSEFLHIEVDSKGRIYVGSETTLGFISVEESGLTAYVELYRVKPEDEVKYMVDVIAEGTDIYFIGNAQFYHYDGKKLNMNKMNATVISTELFDNKVFVVDEQRGLCYYQKGELFEVEGANWIRSLDIVELDKETLMLPTYSRGTYVMKKTDKGYHIEPDTRYQSLFPPKTQILTSAVFYRTGVMAFVDTQDNIHLYNPKTDAYEMVNTNEGLRGVSPIYSLAFSPRGALWVGRQRSVSLLKTRQFLGLDEADQGLKLDANALDEEEDEESEVDEEWTVTAWFSSFWGGVKVWYDNNIGYLFTKKDELSQRIITNSDFVAIIRRVQLIENDSTVFGGAFARDQMGVQDLMQADTVTYEYTYDQNAFRFTFTSNNYEELATIQYQTRLEGLDKKWSPISTNIYREYTNLDWGNYLFRVRAITKDGEISNETTYRFRISPPWHQSLWFFGLQFSTIFSMLILSYFLNKNGIAPGLAGKLVSIVIIITYEYTLLYVGPLFEDFAGDVALFQVGLSILLGIMIEPIINLYKKIIARIIKLQEDQID